MARCDAARVSRAAIIGGGVIGAGWAAQFLARGLDVTAWDPHPEGESRLRQAVANAWPALTRVGLEPGADQGRLRYAATLEGAVKDAQFVQESAPEDEALKTRLLAQIDAAAAPDVVIASSSSGLLPSRIQSGARQPGRILIGHPFNPVYILPLVEVLGGDRTDAAAIDWAMAFYAALGKKPLKVRHEIPGYISDRLQEAVWREALHMVADGVANTAEIDAAIHDGPGLRWAFMGPCLTFHLAGGDSGMAHMLEQFGPALKLPWTKLEAPELTPELTQRMVEGTQAQAGGYTVKEIERTRDELLIELIEITADFRAGKRSGGRRHASVATPYEGKPFKRWQTGDTVEVPLALHRTPVKPEWVDYNGHMSESCFLLVAGDASDALFRYIGIDEAYRASGRSFFTVETHMSNLREADEGDPLLVTTQVLDLDEKRLQIFHAMRNEKSGDLLATAEQMLLHVETKDEPRTAPISPSVYEALQAIHKAHAGLAKPKQAGRSIAIRRKG
ncbi:MAG: L-carnitine dehydrogenase [Kiloniellales bacterium]